MSLILLFYLITIIKNFSFYSYKIQPYTRSKNKNKNNSCKSFLKIEIWNLYVENRVDHGVGQILRSFACRASYFILYSCENFHLFLWGLGWGRVVSQLRFLGSGFGDCSAPTLSTEWVKPTSSYVACG